MDTVKKAKKTMKDKERREEESSEGQSVDVRSDEEGRSKRVDSEEDTESLKLDVGEMERDEEGELTVVMLKLMDKWERWFQGMAEVSKAVSKTRVRQNLKFTKEMRDLILRERAEKEYLKGRVVGRQELMDVFVETMAGQKERVGEEQETYAGKVRAPAVSGVRITVKKVPNVVTIRKAGTDGEQVKSLVKQVVDPRAMDLNVERLTKVRDGIRLEVEDSESVGRLMGCEELKVQGFKVECQKPRNPQIMVYGVGEERGNRELVDEIYARNGFSKEMSLREFEDVTVVRHKFKDKNKNKDGTYDMHVILETSMQVRNWLRKKDRVFIGWRSCKVKDYLDITRCYKCQGYGHVGKFCNRKVRCGLCGGGHDTRTCKRPEEPNCVNCRAEGHSSDHPTWARGCWAYTRQVRRYLTQVGYKEDE